ncbi:MAG: hypothetical protein M1480_02255 [Bacteroidetes bacterium]|nr:hypothetical protein [Bacteroidota bacterium]
MLKGYFFQNILVIKNLFQSFELVKALPILSLKTFQDYLIHQQKNIYGKAAIEAYSKSIADSGTKGTQSVCETKSVYELIAEMKKLLTNQPTGTTPPIA